MPVGMNAVDESIALHVVEADVALVGHVGCHFEGAFAGGACALLRHDASAVLDDVPDGRLHFDLAHAFDVVDVALSEDDAHDPHLELGEDCHIVVSHAFSSFRTF